MAAARLDKTLPFLLPLSRVACQSTCISKITSRGALSTVLPQSTGFISFSLPRSHPYAPSAGVPTSMHRYFPVPEISLCRSTWKLLFLIQIQIYVDIIIIIFSMENNSLLFASSYLSLCSQAWIDDFVICPSSSIRNLPPPRGAHKLHGKNVPTA